MKKNPYSSCVLIIDFGSQYTQLIARRVREIGVYCEIHPYYVPEELIFKINPDAVILSGGPRSAEEVNAPYIKKGILNLKVPVLGICYGMQIMTKQLGGKSDSNKSHEFGYAKVKIQKSMLFDDIYNSLNFMDVWMSHSDSITEIPPGFTAIANTKKTPYAAIENVNKLLYGLQFHPEVTQTTYGKKILENFLLKIAKCKTDWTTKNIIEDAIEVIRKKVKNDGVILALSGGVDSSVCAALIAKAIGKQLHCLFIDTGLLRLNEGNHLMSVFQDMDINLTRVNAQGRFLRALRGVVDPEKKRKIIGTLFIDIFEEESKKLGSYKWLAQGTIYPDIIESAKLDLSGNENTIKSHHNVGGLPKKIPFKLMEPLRELFKDEVRKVGTALNLPRGVVYRHPFPGPGLALRILGSVNKYYLDILRSADHIFIQELHAHGYYDVASQAFAVFLPIKSVGVKGDCRCYEYVIALRSVETVDFMTAKFSSLPNQFFSKVSRRIINEVPYVSRVVLDTTEKPPATIEWE